MSLRNIIFLFLFLIFGFFIFLMLPSPAPSPTGILADYGDAPDGDLGMDTGYYAPFPSSSPGVLIWDNAGIAAEFPTVGTDPVPGPYMLDVDEFFIGPLARGPVWSFPPQFNPADIPSMEYDATDPADPDGPSNLNPPAPVTTNADCDKENASHNPVGPNCPPVPPYNINMNGILVIWITSRVNAFFITRVWTSPTAQTEGIAYWNMLFDIVRDGEWQGVPGGVDEWVARDEIFPLNPGSFTTLITQPFPWPTSGPFGRLIFPVWARNMVSSESVADTVTMSNWDGSGPAGGFAQGEVEDYFIEWRPIGQILPSPGGGPGGGPSGGPGGGIQMADIAELPAITCPETMTAGQTVQCEAELNERDKLIAICLPNGLKGGVAGDEVWIQGSEVETKVCRAKEFDVTANSDGNTLTLNAHVTPENAAIALIILPGDEQLLGTGPTPIVRGTIISMTTAQK